MPLEGRRIRVLGTVQGVGFRPWVYRLARDCGIAGRVANDARGVTIEAFGRRASLERFLARLRSEGPPAAVVERVDATFIPPEHAPGFVIVESEADSSVRVSIPPDLATCPECLAELRDPANRRFRYPFTNCTNCGPRFTIARGIPYDRAATTMAAFAMCEACRAEYESPDDRRFHAEPNACGACGPCLRLLAASGEAIVTERREPATGTGDPLSAAALALEAGLIVAVKGLGGYHLACDASSPRAVTALRERKRRDEKPFAVMVADLDAAEAIAVLGDAERRLLESIERPIVLVERRPRPRLGARLPARARVAPEVAPDTPRLGVMLPYTPLHHLLLSRVGGPLVMTSGNLSEEPLAYRDPEALERLGGIADLFLAHDREIEAPCDDSVARVIAGRATVLRRSRGFVPRPVKLSAPVPRPVLACGALLKNTFCLAAGDDAWLGPHIGDLDNLATLDYFEQSVERLEQFLQVRPEIVAHDLHPDYPSTTYAQSRQGVAVVGVQHHHAHVVSAMAEHGLAGPVIGLAFDGTGLGTDGTAWGGEWLVADARGFERVATLRPVALAGGDTAIRQVWRLALAVVIDAFDASAPVERLRVFHPVPAHELDIVRQMCARGVQTPLAHGLGRYFDAVGALVLERRRATYEGQVALGLDSAAEAGETGVYPYDLDRATAPWQVDLRPMVRALVGDLLARRRPGVVSARFHNTVVAASAEVTRAVAAERGPLPVVLTGGCFQNARLAEGVRARLGDDFPVHLHRVVPPGDGGIALGQAVVAAARRPNPGC